MYRLTTPTHRFSMSINPAEWTKFIITYSQHDTIILEKTEINPHEIEVIGPDDYVLTVKLSQEETSLFNPNETAYVQIRCQYESGDTFASEKLFFKINDVINDTII